MDRLFIIDTENIGSVNYIGIEGLTNKDEVVFIMSEKSQGLHGITMHDIFNSPARKRSLYVEVGPKNAMDVQLGAYLATIIAKAEKTIDYYILSKDKGYDYLINFMKKYSNVNIKRIENLNLENINNQKINNKKEKEIEKRSKNKKINKSNSNMKTNTEKQRNNIVDITTAKKKEDVVNVEEILKSEIKGYSNKTIKKIANIIKANKNKNCLEKEFFEIFNNPKIYINCKKTVDKIYLKKLS